MGSIVDDAIAVGKRLKAIQEQEVKDRAAAKGTTATTAPTGASASPEMMSATEARMISDRLKAIVKQREDDARTIRNTPKI